MKAVVQRVVHASVTVQGKLINRIGGGLLAFVGFGTGDEEKDIVFMAKKIASLRIFPEAGKESSLSLKDTGGELLLVSQFTLYGDVKKGARPSFSRAMDAGSAAVFFDKLRDELIKTGITVKTGVFQAMMNIELLNSGPYTIIIDSE